MSEQRAMGCPAGMVDCPECGRQYATPEGECLLCADGGPETVAERAIDRE